MNDVVKKDENTGVVAFDYGQEANSGFEQVSKDDISIPFLNLIQSNSPEVGDKKAMPGTIMNSVTGEVYEEFIFSPCRKVGRVHVEWVPRAAGGGIAGVHEFSDEQLKAFPNIPHPETGKPTAKLRYGENELVETYYLYGTILDPEGKRQVGFGVIPFTSTKIKVYRGFMTAMSTLVLENGQRPPMFAHRARISTIKQHKHGHDFFNLSIAPLNNTWIDSLLDPTNEDHKKLMLGNKQLAEQVESGAARAAYETQKEEADAPTGEDAPF